MFLRLKFIMKPRHATTQSQVQLRELKSIARERVGPAVFMRVIVPKTARKNPAQTPISTTSLPGRQPVEPRVVSAFLGARAMAALEKPTRQSALQPGGPRHSGRDIPCGWYSLAHTWADTLF